MVEARVGEEVAAVYVAPSDLKPWKRNPRKKALADLLSDFSLEEVEVLGWDSVELEKLDI